MTVDEKQILRTRFKEIRSSLKSPEKDAAILKNFISSPFFRESRFFVYLSVRSEVDTAGLIQTLFSSDKQVFVPRINGGEMIAAPYSGDVERVFGILQPKAGEDCAADVVLTPLLAFDAKGYRLGYGGGYYDKYFANHGGLKVGLAYEGQAVKALPRGEFDVPLHAVITEAGVRYFT